MPNAISLALTAQEFSLKKEESGGRYTLDFKDGDGCQIEVSVTLDGVVLENLIRQASTLIPSPNLELTPPEVNASWRESAWPLKRLSDGAWRLLLREVTSESLLFVLWYLKDVEIARAVLRNMSLRAAAMTTDDLIAKFEGRNPDNLPQEDSRLRGARESLKEMLSLLNRLVEAGQIGEDFSWN